LLMQLTRGLQAEPSIRAGDQRGGAVRCGGSHGPETTGDAFVVLRQSRSSFSDDRGTMARFSLLKLVLDLEVCQPHVLQERNPWDQN